MRTTISLDEDVAAAVEQLRAERRGLGLSDAVNELVRQGLVAAGSKEREPYVHRNYSMGAKVDLSNIGELLDLLDQER